MKKIKKLTPSDVEKIAHDKLHEMVLNAATIDATAIEGNDLILELSNGIKHNAGQVVFHGRDGIDGSDGRDGRDGIDGIRGPQGERGEQGFRGALGPQGIMGPQGERGEIGPIGPQGARGPMPRHEFKSMQDGRLQLRFELPDGTFGDWQILNDRAAIFGGGSKGVRKSYIDNHVLGYTVTNEPETGDILEFNGENLTWVAESTDTKSWAASLLVGNTSVGGGTNNPTLSAGDLLEGTDAGIAITGDTSPYGSATDVLNLTGVVDIRRTETEYTQARVVHFFQRMTVEPSSPITQSTDYHGVDISLRMDGIAGSHGSQVVGAYPFESTLFHDTDETIAKGQSYFQIRNEGAGFLQEASCLRTQIRAIGVGGVIGTGAGLRVSNADIRSGSGFSEQVGVLIESVSGAVTNWAIKAEGGNSYHEGNLYIGRDDPLGTEKLSVNGAIRCDEVITNTSTLKLGVDTMFVSTDTENLQLVDINDEKRVIPSAIWSDAVDGTGPLLLPSYGAEATDDINLAEETTSTSFDWDLTTPGDVLTTYFILKPAASGDATITTVDDSGKTMISEFTFTIDPGDVGFEKVIELPNPITVRTGNTTTTTYAGPAVYGTATLVPAFFPYLRVTYKPITDLPVSAQDATFSAGVIPFADSAGLLTSNSEFLWVTDRLQIGNDVTGSTHRAAIMDVDGKSIALRLSAESSDTTIRTALKTDRGNISLSDIVTNTGGNSFVSISESVDAATNANAYTGLNVSLGLTGGDLTSTTGGLVGMATYVSVSTASALTKGIGHYNALSALAAGGTIEDFCFYCAQGLGLLGTITNVTGLELLNSVGTVTNSYAIGFEDSSTYVTDNSISVKIDSVQRWIPTNSQSDSYDSIQLTTGLSAPSPKEGTIFYDDANKALGFYNDISASTAQIPYESWVRVKNNTGVQIDNGQVVYIVGNDGTDPTVALAIATSSATSLGTIGIATHDIADGEIGQITTSGVVRGLNTVGYTAGDRLYLSETVAGAYQTTKPNSPNYQVILGTVGVVDGSVGTVNVQISSGENTNSLFEYWNGAILESHIIDVTSTGTVVSLSLEKTGGGDVNLVFDGTFTAFDATPAATVTLTPGSDTAPTENYVYIPKSTAVLTVSTSGFPTTEQFVPVATCMIQSAASVATNGAYKVHAWTDHITDSVSEGHAQHINSWIRNQNATWLSGGAPTATRITNPAAIDNVYHSNTSGVALQLHSHPFPAKDMQTGSIAYVINDFTTAYDPITDLGAIDTDSAGNTLRANNTYYSLVIWMTVSEDPEDCQLFVNVPSGEYSTAADAINDPNNYDNYTIPKEYRGTGILLSRVVLRYQTLASGTFTVEQTDDLRGQLPNVLAGSGTATTGTTEFSDNLFKWFNVLDSSKEVDVDLSGLTTGTTRTITMADRDLDLANPVFDSVTQPVTDVATATHSLAAGENWLGVSYTATGAVTITLTTAQAINGRDVVIKDTGGQAGTAGRNITIDTQGAETIDGAATATIDTNYESLRLRSDGTNWFIY